MSANIIDSQTISLSEASITSFARQFDPQPYHLDREAGAASIFGGLCASGWQVAALATRLAGEALIESGVTFVEVTRIGELRWKKPTFLDESIQVKVTTGERTESSRIPDCHSLSLEIDVLDAAGEVVATLSAEAAIEASSV